MSDFIADFLTVLRNGSRAKKEKLTVPTSRLTTSIAEILKREGFIDNYKVIENGPKRSARVHLRYLEGKEPVLRGIESVSTPGLRKYVGYQDIPRVLGGLGIAVLSTSKGLKTDKEARQEKLGGEYICRVW